MPRGDRSGSMNSSTRQQIPPNPRDFQRAQVEGAQHENGKADPRRWVAYGSESVGSHRQARIVSRHKCHRGKQTELASLFWPSLWRTSVWATKQGKSRCLESTMRPRGRQRVGPVPEDHSSDLPAPYDSPSTSNSGKFLPRTHDRRQFHRLRNLGFQNLKDHGRDLRAAFVPMPTPRHQAT